MDSVRNTSTEAASAAVEKLIVNKNIVINAVAVVCGLALVVLACMATSGLDLSAGFF